jgi:tetratricopeptide (TPR) repeat protein
VSSGRFPIVGRDRELAELSAALDEARAGRGGLWLLSGEPGIGKSRLADELTREALKRGCVVLTGRCWEEGGAPAHWPFIQALRAAIRSLGEHVVPKRSVAALAQLLPELGAEGAAPATLAGDQARFQLLDAVATVLCRAAEHTPLLVLLEDLHAADHASLAMLDFVARQLRGSRVLLLGTYRDAEVHRSDAATLLLRIAQDARVVPLARLAQRDVAAFLGGAFEHVPEELSALVAERTEGNPLFVLELTRLLMMQPSLDLARARAVPPTVRTTIEARLRELPPSAREALELTALLARDVPMAGLSEAFARDPQALRAALERCEQAGLVVQPEPGIFRCSHTLVREVVHDAIDAEQRASLHLALGRHLAAQGSEARTAAWSEAAHHLFLAGAPGCQEAVAAATRAAEQATAQLAFEEAARWYERALTALSSAAEAPLGHVASLLVGKATALLRSGAFDAGRATCARAAQLARELDDAGLLAEAALAYGSVMRFAQIDERLVELLEEAERALGTEDSSLRARVLTRLAAAQQPADDPRGPIALAREGIEIARRLGEPATLLAAMRDGGSAMVDLEDAEVCVPYNRQHAELASRLGARTDAWRARVRLTMNRLELGDLQGARADMDAVRQLAHELDHPAYFFRARALDAGMALWEGRFQEAEDAIDDAQRLGEQGGDPNAHETATYQRMRLYRVTGRHTELAKLVPHVAGLFGGTPTAERIARAWSRSLLLAIGENEQALRGLRDLDVVRDIEVGDPTMWEALSELALASGQRAAAALLRTKLEPRLDRLITGGVIGMTVDGVALRPMALACLTLGERDEALAHFDRGLGACRRLAGEPMVAWMAQEAAALAAERASTQERARGWLDEAHEIAERLGMSSVRTRVADVRAALSGVEHTAVSPLREGQASSTAQRLTLTREGDVWRVEHQGGTHRIKDLRGMQLLAKLVEEPGREMHVLDLVGASDATAGAIDLGDAGEVIDKRARAAYAARLRDLDATIAEAEDWNDLARLETARGERDALARELSRALGLGGRERRSGAAAERARVNVQRRLRDAIRRIEEHDAALARHLERSLRTGAFCSYEPE